jgi:hypothetical protein
MTCRRPSPLFSLALLSAIGLPAAANEPPEVQAAKAANRARIWARHIFVSVRGEPIDQLAAQVGQQLMTRVRAEESIARRPVSAYAADCTVAELCEGLAAGFGYRMVPYVAAESVHFQVEAGAAPRPATPMKPKAAKPGTPKAAARPAPKATPSDPRLLQKLYLSEPEVDDEHGGLPMILEALSQAAGVPILADHGTHVPAPGTTPASRFLAEMNGLTLREALDRTARAFNYRWAPAGRWLFFKPAR